MHPKISAIAAITENRGLGKNNELIVRISDDMKRLKNLTMGHPLIMGRKTYESIGKPLPGRTNIVVTSDKKFEAPGCTVVYSIDEALDIARSLDQEEIFIFGGAKIYAEMFPYINRLYLTLVPGIPEADVFFPDYTEFTQEIEREERESEGQKYTWVTLERP